MIESICSYAEANKLDGDISTRLDISLADKEQPGLTDTKRVRRVACS